MEVDQSTALEVLKRKILGNYIAEFSVGNVWSLRLNDGNRIIAQEIHADEELKFTNWFRDNYPLYQTIVDKGYIAQCAIVAANMQKLITDIKLNDDNSLTIEFEHGGRLILPSTVDIVDWQWALNEHGGDPYVDFIVGCFGKDDLEVNPEKQK